MLRAFALTLATTTAATAFGQAACCTPAAPPVAVQPTIAYSPVVAAPAPAVYQARTVSSSWYPGKYLGEFSRNLFGVNETTVVTPAPVVANYAPAPYTAGYAPTPYVAGYAPSVAYRPTYPATYGPVTQTVSRPVVLSPVMATAATACNACTACGGVEQAYYDGGTSTCSACSGSSSFIAPSAPSEFGSNPPRLAPDSSVPDERSNLKPEPADTEIDEFNDLPGETPANPSATSDYFQAPPLFAPPSNNNVARRMHPAPVRTAVYREPASVARTTFRPASGERPSTSRSTTPRPPIKRLSADGWRSATD